MVAVKSVSGQLLHVCVVGGVLTYPALANSELSHFTRETCSQLHGSIFKCRSDSINSSVIVADNTVNNPLDLEHELGSFVCETRACVDVVVLSNTCFQRCSEPLDATDCRLPVSCDCEHACQDACSVHRGQRAVPVHVSG